MHDSERAAELRRLILKLLSMIRDEKKLRKIYTMLNRMFCE